MWPPCGRRRVGAPSRQLRWVELLCPQINQELLIPEGLTANVPDWWTPRQSLVSAVDALSADAHGWAEAGDASKWQGDKFAQTTVLLAARAAIHLQGEDDLRNSDWPSSTLREG